mmetsp:Transcript_19319/g.61223  ORF Transcript_19319/g.61223 Transcript_19319/m.61223 type:complete len:367 (+) Transcript_19319:2-1102(+)
MTYDPSGASGCCALFRRPSRLEAFRPLRLLSGEPWRTQSSPPRSPRPSLPLWALVRVSSCTKPQALPLLTRRPCCAQSGVPSSIHASRSRASARVRHRTTARAPRTCPYSQRAPWARWCSARAATRAWRCVALCAVRAVRLAPCTSSQATQHPIISASSPPSPTSSLPRLTGALRSRVTRGCTSRVSRPSSAQAHCAPGATPSPKRTRMASPLLSMSTTDPPSAPSPTSGASFDPSCRACGASSSLRARWSSSRPCPRSREARAWPAPLSCLTLPPQARVRLRQRRSPPRALRSESRHHQASEEEANDCCPRTPRGMTCSSSSVLRGVWPWWCAASRPRRQHLPLGKEAVSTRAGTAHPPSRRGAT